MIPTRPPTGGSSSTRTQASTATNPVVAAFGGTRIWLVAPRSTAPPLPRAIRVTLLRVAATFARPSFESEVGSGSASNEKQTSRLGSDPHSGSASGASAGSPLASGSPGSLARGGRNPHADTSSTSGTAARIMRRLSPLRARGESLFAPAVTARDVHQVRPGRGHARAENPWGSYE